MSAQWAVTVAGERQVFDDVVLSTTDGDATRRAVLAELLRWGMLVAAADHAHRAVDSAYRNWRGMAYMQCTDARDKFGATAEWKIRSRVEATPEFPLMKQRLADAEQAASQVRAIYDALQRRSEMLTHPHLKALAKGSGKIPVERCEPGRSYMVQGKALTFVGVDAEDAVFRDGNQQVRVQFDAMVGTFGEEQ